MAYSNTTQAVNQVDRSVGGDVVSEELLNIFHTISNAFLGAILATVGIAANVISLAVFTKQGFSETVNVSLFSLALSDLFSLLALQVCNLIRNPLFYNNVPVIVMEAQHLMAGWPHAFFTRLTGVITAYITLERCLCILIPLKVKRVLTPRVSVISLILIFIVLALTLVPDYSTSYYHYKFDPKRNRTVLGLLFVGPREKMAYLSFTLSMYTQLLPFVAVVIFTATLVVKLQEKSRWRTSTSSVGHDPGKNKQAKEAKTVRMVILIAAIYCICFLPYVTLFTVTSIVPEFNMGQRYGNAFGVCWGFAFLVDSINATPNAFVYYRMSSKYRKTVQQLFPCWQVPGPSMQSKRQTKNSSAQDLE